jgi:hypothetical protein
MIIPNTYVNPSPGFANTNFSAFCENGDATVYSGCANFFGMVSGDPSTDGTGAGLYNINILACNTLPANCYTGGTGSDTGGDVREIFQLEIDINTWLKPGNVQPLGRGDFIRLVTSGNTTPNAGLYGIEFVNGAYGTAPPMSDGILMNVGSATIGIDLGSITTDSGSASMPIYFRAAGGTTVASYLQELSTGQMSLNAYAGLYVGDDNNSDEAALVVAGASTNGTGIELIGTGATNTNKYIRVNGGSLQILSGEYGLLFGITDAGVAAFYGTVGLTPVTWTDTQTCVAGQISVDASYVYVCTASNTVKRATLSTF